MSLQQNLPQAGHRIRWVSADCVRVDDAEWRHSFALNSQRTWSLDAAPPDKPIGWSQANWQALLDQLKPQILLVGSGEKQQFLPASILAFLMRQGVGVECMDNHAAARTFNLLADEDRPVAAVFTLG